ncbi:MAG: hypothetical protein ACI9WU_000878 [Myxococcota bacterium]|jgi:hypothetical protein
MDEYFIGYRGGRRPETPEAGAEQHARWQQWVTDLGDAVVNPGTPLGKSAFITADGVSDEQRDDAMTGFSIVKAADMGAALAIAKACPFVEMGTVELARVMKMGR